MLRFRWQLRPLDEKNWCIQEDFFIYDSVGSNDQYGWYSNHAGVVAVCFAAQAFGITLTPTDYLTVIATATLASIGTAGVPSVGLITLSMVFASVGLPVEAIAMIMGIDRILDMARTMVNITGDAMCTVIVANQDGALNRDVFNSK